jgi:hypothetical protein
VIERLADLYWELQGEDDPVGLEAFIERVRAGEFGAVTASELRGFLRSVEARLVRAIEAGEAGAHDGTTPEERIEESREWIADLVEKFCGGG